MYISLDVAQGKKVVLTSTEFVVPITHLFQIVSWLLMLYAQVRIRPVQLIDLIKNHDY